jgi:TyrR family helix-turn-helix protein
LRIEIKSQDRLGISQEILATFAEQAWDIFAIEVSSQFTFVHLQKNTVTLNKIKRVLSDVTGVIHCREVDFLPTESRERHLKALLDKIPDPIIDIDENGMILAINQACEKLLRQSGSVKKNSPNTLSDIKGGSAAKIFNVDITLPLVDRKSSQAIEINGKTYIAEISPVLNQENNSGAVITLKSMGSLGQQISILQPRDEQGLGNILGKSANIQLLKEQIKRFAELDLPVLINGETGTGKELVARALHNSGHRSQGPFLAINCATLPEHLLESELFGYANGAFTGAQKGGKPGLFELAEGGTVFLDEIAEMSFYLQAKLLRFLQDFKFRRLGGTQELQANVRIISATHQNLSKHIESQSFREDLFYRLNVLSLQSPPLRERVNDVPILVEYFVGHAAGQVAQKKPHIDAAAMTLLKTYPWPGNIRELQNVLFRAVALNEDGNITAKDIRGSLAQFEQSDLGQQDNNINEPTIVDWAGAQLEFEKQLINEFYPLYPTTRKLAERLKVSHNKIAMKLRQLGIKR